MSDSYREHHPLLGEDASDEELRPQTYRASFRRHHLSGSRAHLKGAAAIIRRWPGHWSASVTYWWIGLGMVSIIIFIFYNTILFTFLPPIQSKPMTRLMAEDLEVKESSDKSTHEIFMHLIVNSFEDPIVNQHLPYIEIISEKIPEYKYNLVLVLNNTTELPPISGDAEKNNENVLNSLWDTEGILYKDVYYKNNIHMKHVLLNDYLDNSPLKGKWRHLPRTFLEFMLRAVSIWEKGGIAINPLILTPQSPHAVYIERFKELLQKHVKLMHSENHDNKATKVSPMQKHTKKNVNNIRDIIDALEDDDNHSSSKENLVEAENIVVPYFEHIGIIDFKEKTHQDKDLNKVLIPTKDNAVIDVVTAEQTANKNSSSVAVQQDKANRFLTSVLDYVFKKPVNATSVKEKKHIRKRKHAIKGHNKSKTTTTSKTITPEVEDERDKLTIDVEGNIVATEAPCHAFIGTIFTNVEHHLEKESVTDFIVSELSVFCKGTLSACKGIDVILTV